MTCCPLCGRFLRTWLEGYYNSCAICLLTTDYPLTEHGRACLRRLILLRASAETRAERALLADIASRNGGAA